ncbi:hypothetical protein D3C71_77910 [compost metagenome]
MSTLNNYYSIYVDSVLQLAETIVIKSQATVDAMNQYVMDYHGGLTAVDTLDPRSWKYYRNVSGEYHSSDVPMQIVSMDTLEPIIFSKESLLVHRATARGYVYGTRQYRELVSRYPEQEMLILGILYPVDIDEAIDAPDFKILGYPPSFVEVNEYSLIARLQQWIDGYQIRWYNQQFGISDELYPATSLGIMYIYLAPAIITLRLEACKTNEAHSFHVRQYLASHGALDVFMDQLTLRQSLWLYRNIAYIERNSGQTNVFEWLIEHIMTERSLPIAEYVMRHNLREQPEEIYPKITFRKNHLNLGLGSDPSDTKSLQDILFKEDKLAVDNPDVRLNEIDQIQSKFENSLSNVVLTKALESSMWDYSNATPYTMEDTLINHWLWLSSNGLYYQAVVAVNNPKTGERIPMVVKDAFIFMMYAFCKSVDIDLVTIPPMYAKRVQRIPTPTVDDLMSVVDHSYVKRQQAVDVLAVQPSIPTMISTEAFYNKCKEINDACQYQRKYIALQEHQYRRGLVHGMVSRIYSDNICQLAPVGTTYESWFAERNIKIEDFERDDLELAWLQLVKDATGMSLVTTNSLRALQAAMVRLMTQLSSYTVQFMREINETDIRVGDMPAVRIGDMLSKQFGMLYVQDLVAQVQHYQQRLKRYVHFDISGCGSGGSGFTPHLHMRHSQAVRFEIPVKIHEPEGPAFVWRTRVWGAPVGLHYTEPLPENDQGIIPVPGLELFLPLIPQEKAQLRDVWRHNWPVWPPAGNLPLDQAILDQYLPGFDLGPPPLDDVVFNNHLPGFDLESPIALWDMNLDGFDPPSP